jgi:diacylglycerol kinase (ATP)
MKNRNFVDSLNNAINGIIYVIKTERNMKIHVSAAIFILIFSLFYELTRIEFLIVCLTIGAVIICELFNTAVEVLVNIITDVYHPKVKIIKDVAAGAVLVSAFVSLIVAYFIFFDRVSTSLEIGVLRVRQSPMHITIISLLVTIILVLVLKAGTHKGTPFKGGMPSGHAAIAFAITTAIALWTDNVKITILCLIISILLIQSRLEGKIHSIMELIAGAALGFLVTLLLFQAFSGG